jgi:hypothetical protein
MFTRMLPSVAIARPDAWILDCTDSDTPRESAPPLQESLSRECRVEGRQPSLGQALTNLFSEHRVDSGATRQFKEPGGSTAKAPKAGIVTRPMKPTEPVTTDTSSDSHNRRRHVSHSSERINSGKET